MPHDGTACGCHDPDDRAARPAFRVTPDTLRYADAISPEVLAQLVAPSTFVLSDEQICTCGHLEADHRIDGPCSRCMRCPGYVAIDSVEDPTLTEAKIPTDAEMLAALGGEPPEAA